MNAFSISSWAGTKQYLSVKYVVLSALSLVVSVFLFIAYSVLETAYLSNWARGLAKIISAKDTASGANADRFIKRYERISGIFTIAWPPVFYASVLTGFGGSSS
jgi:hypothetical protein